MLRPGDNDLLSDGFRLLLGTCINIHEQGTLNPKPKCTVLLDYRLILPYLNRALTTLHL